MELCRMVAKKYPKILEVFLTFICFLGHRFAKAQKQEPRSYYNTEQLWIWPVSEWEKALYTWLPEVSPAPRPLHLLRIPQLASKTLEQVKIEICPKSKTILHNSKTHSGWKSLLQKLCPFSSQKYCLNSDSVQFCINKFRYSNTLMRHGLWQQWFKLVF